MQAKKTNKRRFIIFFSIPVLACLITGYVFLSKTQNWWPYNTIQSVPEVSNTTNDPNAIDKSYGSNKNSDKPTSNENPDSDQTSKKPVQVGISYAGASAGKLEIEAFTPDIIEGTGKCTATLSKDGTIVTESSEAFIDATTSQCRQILIDLSRLSSGVWSLVINYDSPTSQGKSSIVEVSI